MNLSPGNVESGYVRGPSHGTEGLETGIVDLTTASGISAPTTVDKH